MANIKRKRDTEECAACEGERYLCMYCDFPEISCSCVTNRYKICDQCKGSGQQAV